MTRSQAVRAGRRVALDALPKTRIEERPDLSGLDRVLVVRTKRGRRALSNALWGKTDYCRIRGPRRRVAQIPRQL